ncbi:GYDIA family GHMP kinase [Epilithonimonas arachidiradicis]|uniref:Mevalonate kinase n=2 Tax=Epilithonimonas arachidiradicis TaxID=1617282 RepID=A0A420DDE0_9FLAO|nr:GYDIA family GHMP kinase [Epilithonimonas arachidiradicis]RKE89930.1 mevalonate kinase [Epilithonimonas arachidiradicis]
MSRIFSPGKLMLTSEYVAVDGALVLAIPTKLGQELFYTENEDQKSLIVWEAYHQNQVWLKAVINYKNWEIFETNDSKASEFILKTLKNVQNLSDTKLKSDTSYHIKTNLQFPSDFGLGSSSTLMNNLAEWANIDAFILNEISLGGSGYDVAVAKEKSAVLYSRFPERTYHKIDFNPSFKNELIFIHLNQKQDTREGISHYKSKPTSTELINDYSKLTKMIVNSQNLEEFSELMTIHEQKLSDFLGIPTVKEKYFQNCPSFVKSLGAWGGDFVLASKFGDYESYFKKQGFPRIFSWPDLIN